MDANTAILVAIIGAIFAGIAMLLKIMLPYVAKRMNGKHEAVLAVPRVQAQPSQPAFAHTLDAEASGRYDAQPPRPPPSPPWQQFTDTLRGMEKTVEGLETKFDGKFDGMKEDFKELKAEVAAESSSNRENVTKIHRALGRLEGKAKAHE